MEDKMSSRIRNALNAGIAALTIGAAAIALAPAPAQAFSIGGFGHMGGFGHLGSLGHTGSLGHLGGLGHGGDLGHTSAGRGLGNAGHGTHADRTAGGDRGSASGKNDAKLDRADNKPHSDNLAKNTSDGGRLADNKSSDARDPRSDGDFDGRDPGDHYKPYFPGRLILADGPGQPNGGAVADGTGPNSDTPDQIVKVANPCAGAKLLVTTATSSCVNGVVQISGNRYYYCAAKNEFEVQPYQYTPRPNVPCQGNGTIAMPADVLPQNWTSTRDANVHACVDSGKTVVEWVTGGKYWEKLTWHVYKCFDNATGAEVTRLFPTPDRETTTTLSSDDPPVTASNLRN
jgi:hypothetical protein